MVSLVEEWRPVKGREGKNEVSNLGRVRSLDCIYVRHCRDGRTFEQSRRGRVLRGVAHTGGYLTVALAGRSREYIHRIVMAAFVGPSGGQDVNHIDGDKTNNRLDNLEYCDRLHNVRHAISTGLQDNAGEGNGMHKLTTEQVIAAHGMVRCGHGHGEVARKFSVSESCIEQIAKGVRWKHLGLPALA